MDRHFCDTYTNAFAVSNSDGYPKPKRHANCNRVRLPIGDCHRQSNPIGDKYAFAHAESDAYAYSHTDTDIANPQPFAQTG